MKKLYFNIFLILTVMVLGSCAEKEQTYTDDYNRLTDYQIEYHSYESRVTQGEKGYYFLNGHVIYYMDRDDDTPVILDNRPNNECLSTINFRNCNAFVDQDGLYSPLFQFYEDKLYTIEFNRDEPGEFNSDRPFVFGEYELVSRKPNGEGRKVHFTFPNIEIDKAAIHRGYLYYVVNDYGINGSEIESGYKLLRLPLNKLSSEPEVIFDAGGEQITQFIPYGSQIYFSYGYVNVEKRYDLNSKEITDLWELDLEEDDSLVLLGVYEDQLYFKYYFNETDDTKGEDYLDKKYITIHASNLDGSNPHETDIPLAKVTSLPYFDENYTYVQANSLDIDFLLEDYDVDIDEDDSIKVYDNDEHIYSIPYPDDLYNAHMFFFGDDRFMFISDSEGSYADGGEVYFMMYLDKRDIASGKAEFKRFIETPSMFHEVNNPLLEGEEMKITTTED